VTVSASQGLPWTAVTNDGWIAITSGSSGSGNGTVNYSVSANASPTQRTGTMTIAGLTFTVTEAAATGGGGGLSAFDGTYDMTVWYSYNGTPTSQTASQYFIVTNGAISSSFGDLGGSVLDTAGDVRFTGPCPTNSKGATYTGQLFASSPKSGNGAYVCGDGLTNNWSVSNGR
ncbi:MAG TPA: BACON domain-containing carbohydrate-binding protein, partial [Thermoanaerobaculia bacterium]|nr:BACON domain-containing carbohydrate-binding protein [Thermoanaerobaculia bacterium]